MYCIFQPNELQRVIKKKLGGQTGGQAKIWGAWPTQPPLESPLRRPQQFQPATSFRYFAKMFLELADFLFIRSINKRKFPFTKVNYMCCKYSILFLSHILSIFVIVLPQYFIVDPAKYCQ